MDVYLIGGIDPSINASGCVVMGVNDSFDIVSVKYHSWSTVAKNAISTNNVEIRHTGRGYDKKLIYQRQDFAEQCVTDWLSGVEHVGFEDFSYGSKDKSSSLFQIAEFSGFLRRKLYLMGCKIHRYSPTAIKEMASGSGSASKFMMHLALKETYPQWIPSEFVDMSIGESPMADMVDAFWMAEATRLRLAHRAGVKLSSSVMARISKVKKKSVSILDLVEETP